MSRRVLIGCFMTLCAGAVAAERPAAPASAEDARTLQLGESDWILYRPVPRRAEIYDFDYMMKHLRSDQPGLALRFGQPGQLRFDLLLAPLFERSDYVGPVCDMDIGATRLTVSFSF